jgi:molecular chaperone GrpE
VRPLLLDIIDLRDRLLAAQKFSGTQRSGWLDRLLHGKASGRESSGEEAWREGLSLMLRRVDQVLLDRRVIPLRMEGQPFDPRHARVVATSADSAAADGTVIEEVRTGFLWDEQVLRTAEVIVSKANTRTGDTP